MRERRKVVVDGDPEPYESITEAAKVVGIPGTSLARMLRIGHTNYNGHTFAYFSEVEAVVEAWKPKMHKPGDPLLPRGHVTHRLGAYKEQRV